jgi:hypothetical protein
METFITHDGTDANNVRAEVYVQKGEGTISDIKESGKGTADISFKVGNLKFPVHGWVNSDSAIFEEAKKCFDNKSIVKFRIESQRKTGVNRETPIQELRESMSSAKKNVITILASLNNVISTEAVTLPDDDPEPKTQGRIKAVANTPKPQPANMLKTASDPEIILNTLNTIVEQNLFTPDVIASVTGQALAAGATLEQVRAALYTEDRLDNSFKATNPPPSFSVEAPSWKTYNSDGRANLGHASILAAAGVESYVRNYLNSKTTLDFNESRYNDAVIYLGTVILSISDKIQKLIYGSGFRADRGSSSHVKIRGIVFDTIDNYYSIPFSSMNSLEREEVNVWIKNVGTLAYERYKNILKISDIVSDTGMPIPDSLQGGQDNIKPTEEEASVVNLVEDYSQEEQVEISAEVKIEDAVDGEEKVDTVSIAKYPQIILDESMLENGTFTGEGGASEETINMFKEMVEEFNLSKDEISKISKLLAWTFGPKFVKAKLIPDDELIEFIDFYVASGADNFQLILRDI